MNDVTPSIEGRACHEAPFVLLTTTVIMSIIHFARFLSFLNNSWLEVRGLSTGR
jgi:hypothetical protein